MCIRDSLPDAGLQRFKVNGDNGKNSWYVLYTDGIAAGSFGNWKTGLSERWCAKNSDELSENERTERDRKWKQQQQERKSDQQRQQDKSAAHAALILESARPAADDHPYLINKAVSYTHLDVYKRQPTRTPGVALTTLLIR